MIETQKSLRVPVEIEGIGLHSGSRATVRILPAPSGSGLVFVRKDLGDVEIPALCRHLTGSAFATTLARGPVSVATVEHLLSALQGLEIDNARIELGGPEVPILDGSALPFVETLQQAGVIDLGVPRRFMTLTRPIVVRQGDRELAALPANALETTYAIDFPHPAIGYQAATVRLDVPAYVRTIAPARTFCLLRDVEAMKKAGLALGGSLHNALVVGDHGVLNDSLRFQDEFVRHKILDLIGDLALLGAPLRAHLIAFKGGHRLHAALVDRILSTPQAWRYVTSEQLMPAAELARFARLRGRLAAHNPVALSA
ncbi:MAG TPA: UDP-3-O-acyl-N-acetylglucosamine deacetylase [Candidatus Polarisedimenticolia bacterium]|nr:UDP-3-O-acyl-N-acetylglucosamine deacetylase [Candidatus Polarisedimenticolia bacterium]